MFCLKIYFYYDIVDMKAELKSQVNKTLITFFRKAIHYERFRKNHCKTQKRTQA